MRVYQGETIKHMATMFKRSISKGAIAAAMTNSAHTITSMALRAQAVPVVVSQFWPRAPSINGLVSGNI